MAFIARYSRAELQTSSRLGLDNLLGRADPVALRLRLGRLRIDRIMSLDNLLGGHRDQLRS